MNAYEAALLPLQIKPRLAVPMHHGMWPDEDYGTSFGHVTLDPTVFEETYRKLEGSGRTATLQVAKLDLFVLAGGTVQVTYS
jgi:L-ascorbate metabolism protein UlaG (beta-lactamase superfamily)